MLGNRKTGAEEASTEVKDGQVSECDCSCGCNVEEAKDGLCCIKVLGSGCKNCHALLESTKEAVRETGLGIEVRYVTDMQEITKYGVMSMPALVVNEKVASMGKVLKAAEVEELCCGLSLL